MRPWYDIMQVSYQDVSFWNVAQDMGNTIGSKCIQEPAGGVPSGVPIGAQSIKTCVGIRRSVHHASSRNSAFSEL